MVSRPSLKGFTLIELSIVMMIIGVLIGILFFIINTRNKSSQAEATLIKLDRIERSLAAYVGEYRRLPCPAGIYTGPSSTGFGTSQGNAESCSLAEKAGNVAIGTIPVRTLGLNDDDMIDGWGKRFTYAMIEECNATDISTDVNYSSVNNFTNCVNAIEIVELNGYINDNNIYMILSAGPNGKGGVDYYGNRWAVSQDSNEAANSTITGTFYNFGSPDQFDDILISGNRQKILRMINALERDVTADQIYCELADQLSQTNGAQQVCGQSNATNCAVYMESLATEIVKRCF